MSTAHLAKGSTKPPKKEGLLRLYSMAFCPYAERARLVLLLKNIPHDIVNIDLKNKPEWLFDINSEGKVPVLDTGSQIITESLVISDYLDETYPEPPLYPKDPAAVQKDKELIKSFDTLIGKVYVAFFNKDNLTLAQRYQDALPELEKWEKELGSRGLFFGGKSPSMVDYMIWPWAERVGVLQLLYSDKAPVNDNDFPKLRAWYAALLQQPIIQETVLSNERFHKLLLQYKADQVDYDSI